MEFSTILAEQVAIADKLERHPTNFCVISLHDWLYNDALHNTFRTEDATLITG